MKSYNKTESENRVFGKDESHVESYLKRQVEKLGGRTFKWVSPGCTGVPDRIVILPGGRIYFIELKTEIGKTVPRQKFIINVLQELGCNAEVLKGRKQVDEFINGVKSAYMRM